MATVWAFVRTTTSKKKVNLRFRFRDGDTMQLFHTSELLIYPKDWDNKTQKVNASFSLDKTERLSFDNAVNERKQLIFDLINPLPNYDGITSEWLEQELDKKLNPQKYAPKEVQPQTLFEWIEYFIETAPERKDKETGRLLSSNNIQQYKATFKHLTNFAKQNRKKDFHFEQIDIKFYENFVDYLQDLNFTANTVGKHIRVLKLMLNEATRKKVNTTTDYLDFHVFTEDTDTVYLTEQEIQAIADLNLSQKPYLDRVRDWFLLLCWTGSRFSDLEKVGKANIQNGFITFRQQKTNNKVVIPLHPVVLSILNKYEFSLPEPITNQRFNEYIKEVAQLAAINTDEPITRTVGGVLTTEVKPKHQLVSSHTGRRSFCTNMYKRGIPTLTIMSISGHRTEKSFLKYIKVSTNEHAEIMQKMWQNMYNKD